MKLTSNSLTAGARIADELCFCKPDPASRIAMSDNRNPHLAWAELPAGTRSLVVLCHDPDVPSVGDDVNQEGREVPADLARVDFFHWVLVDVDPEAGEIAAGSHSDGITARGKSGPEAPGGARHGVNNYTEWFAGDDDMKGDYYGYDGPCPPWNDSLLHHYHFTVYAIDVKNCPVQGRFTGQDVRQAIKGHVLAQAAIIGTYTLNPRVANNPRLMG